MMKGCTYLRDTRTLYGKKFRENVKEAKVFRNNLKDSLLKGIISSSSNQSKNKMSWILCKQILPTTSVDALCIKEHRRSHAIPA
jgi:hypothetical protein